MCHIHVCIMLALGEFWGGNGNEQSRNKEIRVVPLDEGVDSL